MEWTRTPPTEPGIYRMRKLNGSDDGIGQVERGWKGRRPTLVTTWLGKWFAVEDMGRMWLGPYATFDDARAAAEEK